MARWPVYSEEEIQAVAAVLRSGKVNAWTGPHVSEFERAYARYLGVNHAIALANGTLALELAMKVMDIGPGDEVIVTPRSFFASASSVAYLGARPVFADIDRDSQNITAESIARVLTEKTKAIIVVHLAGWPCDMTKISALARENDLWLIEDCAQAHGALHNGAPVGSFSDVAAFSFCQDKIITTGGEGGLIALNDTELWERAWSLKDHGKSFDAVFHREHPAGFRWLHESFGTNWRMTSMQAVIGLQQLQNLDQTQAKRAGNAKLLLDRLAKCSALRTPLPKEGDRHAWYRLYTWVEPERLKNGWSRDRILQEITDRGATCFSGSCPEIYREKAFQDAGYVPAQRLPNALELGETSLAFLVDPSETAEDISHTASVAIEILEKATRT
jgi:dTDP-4-amino-4,6-dideoxygalactose transaminase